MVQLVLLRHGESVWNQDNRFTGWTDVDLSAKGMQEAKHAGAILKANGFTFDIAITSVLKRAIRTLWITLDEMDLMWVPVINSWRLNERHYGALQGLNKAETAQKYGTEQVALWRRSYTTRPPALTKEDARFPGHDIRYKNVDERELPVGESLEDTTTRFLPYWHDTIESLLRQNKKIIISAHGNSLRALVKYLDDISDEDILKVEIPTGIPLIYEFDGNFKPQKSYYLT